MFPSMFPWGQVNHADEVKSRKGLSFTALKEAFFFSYFGVLHELKVASRGLYQIGKDIAVWGLWGTSGQDL